MKVAKFMNREFVSASPKDSIKKIIKTLYNLRIGALPLTDGKKLIGLVTRDDVISKLYPSIQEFMQDYTSVADFDAMESKLHLLMSKPVSEIMTRNVKTVSPDSPLMKAQSIMLINGYDYLPIVDEEKNLIGLISHGDIFRALIGTEIPFESEEEYHDWIANHYDFVVQWDQRLKSEIQSLDLIFKKQKYQKILDLGCWTGELPIALAKKGYEVLGLERSANMIRVCLEKQNKLPENVRYRLNFIRGGGKALNDMSREFDAAIVMGNSLLHYPDKNFKAVLEKISKSLTKTKSTLILQIVNLEKILKIKGGLFRFSMVSSKLSKGQRYAFVAFYDSRGKDKNELTLNMFICTFDGHRWVQSGMNSTPIANINLQKLTPILKKLGFKKIGFYGSCFFEPLFKQKFDVKNHDWINIVASR